MTEIDGGREAPTLEVRFLADYEDNDKRFERGATPRLPLALALDLIKQGKCIPRSGLQRTRPEVEREKRAIA